MPSKDKKVPVRAGASSGAITRGAQDDLLGSMDRMFKDFESRFEGLLAPFPMGGWMGPGPRRWFSSMRDVRHAFADLIDSGKEFRVVAEVPGIPKEKLEITVTDRELRIEGQAETDVHEEREGFLRRERGYSRVSRVVAFPEPVLSEKAEASLANGILEVRVPKQTATEFKKHKIQVK